MASQTGIDPGSHSIKVVQGQLAGPLFRLTRALSVPVDPDGDREGNVLSAIQSGLGGQKLKPGVTRAGVTGRELMTRYTTIPAVPVWRLRMLMDFEVKDMAESAGDALTADYNILRSTDDGDDVVLVSLVKSTLLDRRLRALEDGAKIKVHATTPNSIALYNAYLAFGDRHDGAATVLVDIGDQNVEVAVEKDGELLFARNLSGGGEMFTQAVADTWKVSSEKARELKRDFGNVTPRGRAQYKSSQEEQVANALLGVAGRLAGMLSSTIAFAKTSSGIKDLTIGRVLISGGGASMRGLDAYLEDNLRLPVQRFQPEAGLDTSALPEDERLVFEADPGSFVCALGLARMSGDPDAFVIDLAPESVKKKRKFLSQTLYMALAGVVAAGFLGVLWWDLRTEREAVAKDYQQAKRNERNVVNVRRGYEERVREAALVRDKVDELAWESRAGTFILRAQRLVQDSAPGTMWVQSVAVTRKALLPPAADQADKKAALDKIVVSARGRLWGAEKPVGQLYNDFLERLRADSAKPVVTDVRTPMKDGDDFEVAIDFVGWPLEPKGDQP
jgi:type IV pilus assembly protein PilM